jgi:hypothetical protein
VEIHSNDGWDIFDLYIDAFSHGVMNSFRRMNPDLQDEYLYPRRIGEALLPLIRFDSYYSHLNSNQSSIDYRLEVGWGAFAYEYRTTRYQQLLPVESLELQQINFLVRLSASNNMGINIGWGDSTLIGAGINYGHNGIVQFFIHGQRWGFEYRDVYTYFDSGAEMEDIDVMLMFHIGPGSLNLGHRMLKIPTQTLRGYYLGYSLRI